MGRKSPRCQQRETSLLSPTSWAHGTGRGQQKECSSDSYGCPTSQHCGGTINQQRTWLLLSPRCLSAFSRHGPGLRMLCNQSPNAKARTLEANCIQPPLSFLQSDSCKQRRAPSPVHFLSPLIPFSLVLLPSDCTSLTTENLASCCLEPQLLVNKTPYILSLSPKCPLTSPDSAQIWLSSRWQACHPTPTCFPGQHTSYCFFSMPPP